MIGSETLFSLGAIGMAGGTAAFLWGARSADGDERLLYGLLVAISGIATVAYAVMALGIGWIGVGDRTVFAPRYVDWILTTPLLLVFLGLLAGVDRDTQVKLVGVNTVVMVVGFGAALVEGPVRFGLFAVAALAYVGLVYLLVGPVSRRAAERPTGIESLFASLRNLTVVLWSVYPVIWLLGPPGLDLFTLTVDVMLIVYLDLLTKVGFGLIAMNASAVVESEFGTSLSEVTGTATA